MSQLTFPQRCYLPIKRLADVLFSLSAIVALLPVFALLWFVVKRGSPGPVFFSQRRMKKPGEAFIIRKYRTMKNNARLLEAQGMSGSDLETKAGKALRRLHIDEIPQLFSVLRGDMSIIGSRPQLFLNEARKLSRIPEYVVRYETRPGLIGIAHLQNLHPSFRQFFRKVLRDGRMLERLSFRWEIDMFYASHVSPRTDLVLFLSFVWLVIVQISKVAFRYRKTIEDEDRPYVY